MRLSSVIPWKDDGRVYIVLLSMWAHGLLGSWEHALFRQEHQHHGQHPLVWCMKAEAAKSCVHLAPSLSSRPLAYPQESRTMREGESKAWSLILHIRSWPLSHTLGFQDMLRNITGFLSGSAVKKLPVMQETRVRSLGEEDPLQKGVVTHSSILAWRIPWTEELGRLQSIGSQRGGHD